MAKFALSEVAMITLEMDGRELLGDDYAKAVRAFVSLVGNVADDIAEKGHAVRVTVTVSSGSARLHVNPLSERGDSALEKSIVSTIFNGISLVENKGERPVHFTNRALANLRTIAGIQAKRREDNVRQSIIIRLDSSNQPITGKSVAVVDGILKADYTDYGTVEGKLQTITERRGLRIFIFDALTDRKVRCHIPPHLRERALEVFGRRVEARGAVHYRHDGLPISITLEDFDDLDDPAKITPASEVYGIFRGNA